MTTSVIEDLDRRAADRTVPTIFLDTIAARPDAVALRWKEGDTWGTLSWREYADRASRVASALRDLGVTRGDRVVLMLRNRPEFHIADTAVLFLGATPVSIYNSSSPEQVRYLAGHCRAKVAIVEDAGFLERLLAIRSDLPTLEAVAVVDEPSQPAPPDVLSWSTLVSAEPLDLAAEVGNARPDDLATVIYTSGTTGPPKGVALDHRNVVWTLESFNDAFEMDVNGFRVVSYLPMAHVAERMVSHYLATAFGFEVTTCPDTTQVVPYLTQTHPELFFAVPRIWEKAYASIRSAIGADPEQEAAFDAALEIGWQASEHRARSEEMPADLAAGFEKADAGLAPIRQLIGLDEVRTAITGAAPIPYEILRFFRGLGVPLSEIYGLSETAGPMTWTPFRVRVGTVGPPLPGVEVRLEEDGEVSCRGGNVFRGYLDSPEKTAEVLDDDGWFHSGDIGVIDDDGYLRIVDRKKELIITAGGKNISPANLEAALKAGPLIGQVCVIGDRAPVRLRVDRPRPRSGAGLGLAARHRWRPRRAGGAPRRPRRGAEADRRGERPLLQGRAREAIHDPARGVDARLRGAHADDEAEAPRRPRQVRRRDRGALQVARRPSADAPGPQPALPGPARAKAWQNSAMAGVSGGSGRQPAATRPPFNLLIAAAIAVAGGAALVVAPSFAGHVVGYVLSSFVALGLLGAFTRVDIMRRAGSRYRAAPALRRVAPLIAVAGIGVASLHVWSIATELAG